MRGLTHEKSGVWLQIAQVVFDHSKEYFGVVHKGSPI
jgi:hypothetical protein